MQRIRTVADIEFNFAAPIENPFLYRILAVKARQLHSLGMSFVEIGKALGITDKTAKKAALATNATKFP